MRPFILLLALTVVPGFVVAVALEDHQAHDRLVRIDLGDRRAGAGLAVSGDGRYVVFSLEVKNVEERHPAGFHKVFALLDANTGTFAEIGPSEPTQQGSECVDITRSGSHVAYSSGSQVFVYDTRTATTTLEGAKSEVGLRTAAHSPVLSDDGRLVAYVLLSWGRTGSATQAIHLRDRKLGTTKVIAQAISPSMSGDGHLLAIDTARALVESDTNETWDAYLLDVKSGDATLVSEPDNYPGLSWGGHSSIAADGEHVLFVGGGAAPNYRNEGARLFLYGRDSKVIEDVTPTVPFRGTPSGSSLSEDGRYMAARWHTPGPLSSHGPPPRSFQDIYVVDRVAEIAELVTQRPDGEPTRGEHSEPRISADGSTVVFISRAVELTGDESGESSDLFLYRTW